MIFPVNACTPLPCKALARRSLFREAENTAMSEEKEKVTEHRAPSPSPAGAGGRLDIFAC